MIDKIILWVGLSNTIGHEALALDTNSGMLIQEIADLLPDFVHCKTNLVPYTPLNEKGKMRYPTYWEMEDSVPLLLKKFESCKPSIVVLLGAQVSNFILKRHFNISKYTKNSIFNIMGIKFIPVDHPSYMLIYKHTNIPEYINMIYKLCNKLSDERKGE